MLKSEGTTYCTQLTRAFEKSGLFYSPEPTESSASAFFIPLFSVETRTRGFQLSPCMSSSRFFTFQMPSILSQLVTLLSK